MSRKSKKREPKDQTKGYFDLIRGKPKPKPLTYEQLMAAQREECKDPGSILNWTMRSGIGSDAARWLVDEFDIFPKEKKSNRSEAGQVEHAVECAEFRDLEFPELTDEDRSHIQEIIDQLEDDCSHEDDVRFLLGLVNDLGCEVDRLKRSLASRIRGEV